MFSGIWMNFWKNSSKKNSRQMLELNPTFVCVALDVQNAHNAMARATVVKELEAVPGLRHLAQHAATCLAAHHSIE